jgi:hypothetical protein
MAIPVYERQKALNALPGVRMNAPGGAQAYGAGVAESVTRLAERGLRMAEDLEDAETLEMYNKFKRDVSQYHNDPDKGALNKLGKDAAGLYAEAGTWMDNKAEEYVRKMKSPRMVQNFRRMAEGAIAGQGEQNSRHEARQIRAYRKAEADATIQGVLNDIAANYADEAFVTEAADRGLAALEVETRGLGDEARKAAVAEYDSGIAAARLGPMIRDDPLAAEAWYKEHKERFTAAARERAEALLERETKAYKTQAAVDGLVRKFGPNEERAGLLWIRKNYSGEEEDRIATAYKARIGELEVGRAKGEAAAHKQQVANFENLYKRYYANDTDAPREVLDKMLNDGAISSAQHRQAVTWNANSADRAGAEKALKKQTGAEWAELPPEERERAVMRKLGVTEEERAGLLAYLTAGVVDGRVSDSDIDAYYRSGWITGSESAHYKRLDNKFSAEQKAFAKRQKDALRNDIGKMFGLEYKGKDDAKSNAAELFDEKIADLEGQENSKTYREDVLKARREALIEAIEATEYPTVKTSSFSGGAYTPWGKRKAQVEGAIDDAIGNVREYRPQVYNSLSSESTPAAEPKDEEKAKKEADWSGAFGSIVSDDLGLGILGGAQ